MRYSFDIQETLKLLFAPIIVGGLSKDSVLLHKKADMFRNCLSRFLGAFSYNIFQDEYAFFYEMLKTLNIKAFSIEQLIGVIDRNRDLILDSPYIDMSKWSLDANNKQATDDEKIAAFTYSLTSLMKELADIDVSEDDFLSAIEIFKDYYIKESYLETVQNCALILSETGCLIRKTNKRHVLYKGVEDSDRYYRERMDVIEAIRSSENGGDTVIDENWLKDDIRKDDSPENTGILDTGISRIDTVVGKMHRSHLISILGVTKGGKTRFTNWLVNRALESGLNVCVWALEGTKEEWISTQTACLIRTRFGVSYNSRDILERNYADDGMRQMCIAAKTIIATDTSRGRLSFMDGSAYIENFIEKLESHYANKNPFDVIVIDPLVNIQTMGGRGKVDRISDAYIALKDYIANKMKTPALALVPAQLKQDVIDSLRRNPLDTIDVTAGGGSAEVIRSADEAFGLFSSKEERASGMMKMYSVASRHSGNFDDFIAGCELGCCWFEDREDLNA